MQMQFLTKPEPDYPYEEIEPEDNILQIKSIRIPVLVINGEYDVQDFHDISDLMSRELPYVKKVIIPDTTHLANLESPKQFFKLISEFFSDSSNN